MRPLSIITTFSLTLLFAGCGGPKEPVSFYLSSQKPTSGSSFVPTNPPVLVVTRLTFVAPDTDQHTISIKFFPADASVIEKLTTENFGKTVVIVQGTNVLYDYSLSFFLSSSGTASVPELWSLGHETV